MEIGNSNTFTGSIQEISQTKKTSNNYNMEIKAKRIINLVTHMEAGGAQGAAIRMSKEMRNRGIDAETWFIYKKSDTYTDEENVLVIHNSPPKNIIHAIIIVYKIFKLLKKNKPDGVISYTHYASTLGHIATYLSGIKNRVATMRNPAWTYPKLAKVLNRFMGRVGCYTKIIAVSETVKDSCNSYSSAYKKHIAVVYNGVPARISKLSKHEARKKFNLNPVNSKLLINLGRLHPQKNQKLLLDTIKNLKDYHLAIAGDGELRDQLEEIIKKYDLSDRVHLMGEIKPNDVPDFLKCGDIFLFPSIFEAFGFAIFEAAYNGLPIIASNIPSNVEVLSTSHENILSGIIVKDMNPTSWVEAIQQLEDPLVEQMYKERIIKKSQEFDFDSMVKSYTSFSTYYS